MGRGAEGQRDGGAEGERGADGQRAVGQRGSGAEGRTPKILFANYS